MSGCISGSERTGVVIVKEHDDGRTDDDGVTEKTQHVRNLIEKEESPHSGEENLQIFIDGQLPGRRVEIGTGNAELTACSAKTGTE